MADKRSSTAMPAQYGFSTLKKGLVFLSLFVLAVLIGCSGGDGMGRNEPSRERTGSGSDENRDPTDPPHIHAMLNNIVQDWEGQRYFIEEYNRLTGVELRITQPPHQSYPERVLLQLASNDVPDIIEVLPEYLPRLVREELVIPLDPFFADARYISSVYPEYLESVRHPDGNLYGVPARDGGGCVTYIRMDWLENVGLSVPQTYEELEAVLHAFTYGDPNRTGRDDTFGYTDVAGGSHDWYNRLALGTGRIEMYYDYSLERWVDGLTRDEARIGLRRLKEWYDAGYVDPDVATNTTFTARTKFINGQAGIFTYWANHWARNLQDRTAMADVPQARIIPLPPPEGVQYIRRVPPVLVITAASPHPDVVFRHFFDGQFDKGPLQMLFTFGVEGYHWERRDGGIAFLENPEDPYEAPFTRSYVPPGSSINDWALPDALDPLVARSIEILQADPYYEKQRWGSDAFNRYFVEIEDRLKPETITAYLSGNLTLDEALQRYRREAERLYLSTILDELNGVTEADEG